MDFDNATGFPGTLARAQLLYPDLVMATVVVKCAFEVGDDGQVRPAEEQLEIVEADVETPYGTVDGDVVPIKDGCDVAVLGPAVASPAGRTVPSLDVIVRIGDLDRRVRVFGDRAWLPRGQGFRSSDPVPFSVMPMDYSRAYGGTAIHHGELTSPYAPNPDGQGYVVRAQDVAGVRLPNVEELDQLVTTWEQQPLPASLLPAPRHSQLRAGRGIAVDLEEQGITVDPSAFSWAHPRMRMPAFPHGQPVEIVGMREAGPWRFRLPTLYLVVQVDLGDRSYHLGLHADTLVLMPRHGRFYALARRALVYEIKPERLRRIRVSWTTAPFADPPFTTIARERDDPRHAIRLEPEDPNALPLPFEDLVASHPLTRIVEELPLCPSGDEVHA